jgi:hypothetical protein
VEGYGGGLDLVQVVEALVDGLGRDLRLRGEGFIEPKFWVLRSLDFWT